MPLTTTVSPSMTRVWPLMVSGGRSYPMARRHRGDGDHIREKARALRLGFTPLMAGRARRGPQRRVLLGTHRPTDRSFTDAAANELTEWFVDSSLRSHEANDLI